MSGREHNEHCPRCGLLVLVKTGQDVKDAHECSARRKRKTEDES